MAAVGGATVKILKRLFIGKDETNIGIDRLNEVDYDLIREVTGYELSKSHTRNKYFKNVVTLKFKKRGDN